MHVIGSKPQQVLATGVTLYLPMPEGPSNTFSENMRRREETIKYGGLGSTTAYPAISRGSNNVY
jgi:hypothetical protein